MDEVAVAVVVGAVRASVRPRALLIWMLRWRSVLLHCLPVCIADVAPGLHPTGERTGRCRLRFGYVEMPKAGS